MLSIGQHARNPRPFGSSAMLPGWLRRWLDLNVDLIQLRLVDRARRAEHQILMALRLGKRNDVANVLGARHSHHQPVDPRRDSAMRWNAVLEGVEQMAELRLDPFAAHAENPEDAFLQCALVDADAPARDLDTVEHAVIRARAHV